MKVLILDPFQHCPSLYRILKTKCETYYYAVTNIYLTLLESSLFSPFIFPDASSLYGDNQDFFKRYNFNPNKLEDLIDYQYDILYWVVSPFDFDSRISSGRSIFLIQLAKSLYNIFNSKVKKIVILDNSDFGGSPKKYLDQMGIKYDIIFKREYSNKFKYEDNVKSFPLVQFGYKDLLWILLYEREKNKRIYDRIFWAGGQQVLFNPLFGVYCNRKFNLDMLKNYIDHYKLDFNQYLQKINEYKFFLNLKGVGETCRRMFEGIAKNSLMISEHMNIVFPFEEWEEYFQLISYKDLSDFEKKFNALKNEEKYNQTIKLQTLIVEKYFNEDWIFKYLMKE